MDGSRTGNPRETRKTRHRNTIATMTRTGTSRRRRQRSRIPRQQPHWSVYLGALLIAVGALALTIAAVLST